MKEQKTTYHWLIVVACFLLMAVSVGILVNVFGPLSTKIAETFSADSGKVQLVFMIAVLANLVGGAVAGKLMAKVPMGKIMPVYAILLSGGILGWSFSSSLGMMYAFSVLAGLGASGVSLVPCGILINNWFQEKKGVATGIAFSGSVVGGIIFVELSKYLLVTPLISAAGWQQVYLVLGIIAAVVSIPVTILIVRGAPSEKGMLPYGATEESLGAAAEAAVGGKGISLGKFIKTGSFWLLAASGFLIGFSNLGVQNNIQAYFETSLKYDANVPMMALQIGFFVQIFAKFLLGWFYDKKGIVFSQIYCVIAFLGCAVLLFITPEYAAGQSVVLPYAFGAVFGLVSSMTTVTPPYLTARIVGTKDYATIFGIVSLFYGVGVAAGPLLAASLSASIGWKTIWIVLSVLMLIMTVTSILSYRKGEGFSEVTD